jgi:hypothetical protein
MKESFNSNGPNESPTVMVGDIKTKTIKNGGK